MILYTVVPCYNEEEMLPTTVRVLSSKYRKYLDEGLISPESRILFVDDGSKDATWDMITEFAKGDDLISAIKLSHNEGHQNALFAGLMRAKDVCDAAVSIDADLQDDVDAIDGMIEKYKGGCDIVYGVRNKRDSDAFLKRFTAEGYYGLMNMMNAGIIPDHADFRLLDKAALKALSEYDEVNLFLRGIVPLIGLKYDFVYYERAPREKGESKYSLIKMADLAVNGITSFTTRPIDLIFGAGVILSALSLLALIILAVLSACGVLTVVIGWILACMFLCTGILLTASGIVGEYVGKAYMEAKRRPRYIIEKIIE